MRKVLCILMLTFTDCTLENRNPTQRKGSETMTSVICLNAGSGVFSNVWELMSLSDPPLREVHERIEEERGTRELDDVDLLRLVPKLYEYKMSVCAYWITIIERHTDIRSLLLDKDVVEKRLFSLGDRCLQERPSPLHDDPTAPGFYDPHYVQTNKYAIGPLKYGIDDVDIYAAGVEILDACMGYLNKDCQAKFPEYNAVYSALKAARTDPKARLLTLLQEYDVALIQELNPDFEADIQRSKPWFLNIFMSKEGPQRTAVITRLHAIEVPCPFGAAARIDDIVYVSVHGSPSTSDKALEWIKATYGNVLVGIDSNLLYIKPIDGYTYTPPYTTVRRTRSIFQPQRNKAGYVVRSGSDRICYASAVKVTDETMVGDFTTPSPTWPFDHNAITCAVEPQTNDGG